MQPFFRAPDTPRQRRRRLLLLSYFFPPHTAVGALRWQKLADFAAERGWGVDAIALLPEHASDRDLSRLAELPAGIRIFLLPAFHSRFNRAENAIWRLYQRARYGARSELKDLNGESSRTEETTSLHRDEILRLPRRPRDLFRAYHAWLQYATDAHWGRGAQALGRRLLDRGVHRVIVSCGPPHVVHDVARRLSIECQVPFVIDMRDPWSLIERIPEFKASPLYFTLARRDERRAISRASLIVANTTLAQDRLREAFPDAAGRVITVMNGYDEEALPSPPRSERFLVAYAGTVYMDRNPRPLFRAGARVVQELSLTPAAFGFAFIGAESTYAGVPIEQMAREEGVESFVTVLPAVPRREVLHFLAQATMLVSLPQDSDMAVPSKIFEYMRFDAWLLALASNASATSLLLRSTEADVVAPDDVDRITEVLRTRYLQHTAGIRPERIARNGSFSRRDQATVLFNAIEERVVREPQPSTQPVQASPASPYAV